LLHVFQALIDLRSERPIAVGMGVIVGQIPWHAILKWAQTYRVARQDEFFELVQFADVIDIGLLDGKERQSPEDTRPAVQRNGERPRMD
jgi:hypothetical protein